MPDHITARDLMVRSFSRMTADRPLEDVLNALLEAVEQPGAAHALVVENADGTFAGLLTARLLFKSLLSLWMPSKEVRADEERLQRELLVVARDRLKVKAADALIRGLPTARPDDRLLDLIDHACDHRLEFVPVLEDDRVVGIVPVTEIFGAAASLALTPGDEGIRHEGKQFK